MRQRRRQLSVQQQRQAACDLDQRLGRELCFIRAKRIAFYLANDGEINPAHLLQRALKQKKHCFLPVLAGKRLRFVRYRAGDRLHRNRFGIPEPTAGSAIASHALDLVLTPLVAFDAKGGRLGMGGGFYDRSFAWLGQSRPKAATRLIGLAHHCQEHSSLVTDSWDIPLHAIATDRAFRICRPEPPGR